MSTAISKVLNDISYSRGQLILFIAILFIGACSATHTHSKTPPTIQSQNFAWPFINAGDLLVRGGSTQGAPVNLDTAPSIYWQALQKNQTDGFEKDRMAILALQGTFRASFQFTEVAGFYAPYAPSRPYFSWGTEYVHVLEDRGDFISLQHTLVMFMKNEKEDTNGPIVMKHWRQDWQYQNPLQFQYSGNDQWHTHTLPSAQVKGQWSQSVYQVDDSPRYQARGQWQHLPSFSSWQSDSFTRPLPRREFSVRDDYQTLQGQHRLTLTPTGWVHQQSNQKMQTAPTRVLAQEIGLNRYERIIDPPLERAARNYWEKTGPYWLAVRYAWDNILRSRNEWQLQRKVDGRYLFEKHFAQAEKTGPADSITPYALQATVAATLNAHIRKTP